LEKQKLIYFTGKNIEFEKLVTHNVALLGDKGVGKTSLVKRFLSSKFDPNIRYTLGILVDEAHIRLSHSGTRDGSQVRLIVHDFAGQPLFIDAYHGLLTDKSAIGLVFSLSDAKTLDNLDSWMGLFSKEEMLTKTFFLIGTKMDLPKKVDEDKIWDFRRKYKIEYYYSTSSLTGEGIQRLFEGFAENTALVPA
jgi:Ras-related protein Rab-8A